MTFFPLKSPSGGLQVTLYRNILFPSTCQKPVIVFICLLISRLPLRTESRSRAVGSCVHVAQSGTCGFLSRGSPPSSTPAAPGISGAFPPEAGMNYKAPDPTIPHGGRWLCLDSNTPFLCAALTSLHFPSSPGDVCRSGSNIYHCVRLYAEPLQPTQPRPTGASLNIPSRAAQTRSLTHAPHQPGGPTSAHSYLCVLRCRAPASAQSPAGLHDPACHPLPRAVPPHSGAPALTDHLLQLVIVPVDGPGQGARVLGHDGS